MPDQVLIVCSDIFGLTPELKTLINEIIDPDTRVDYLCPVEKAFSNEAQAYDAFSEAGGIQHYVQKISAMLAQQSQPFTLLGFSAGGAAAWQAQCLTANPACRQLIGFYPGQIRYFTSSVISVPAKLVFACDKKHFDVQQVMQALATQASVSQQRSMYEHGFMNPRSAGYDATGRNQFSQWLRQQLQ